MGNERNRERGGEKGMTARGRRNGSGPGCAI
jgi:hypothetical protein